MLLGVSGRSLPNGSDERSTSRLCLLRGLKQSLKQYARTTAVKELQEVCAFGRKASKYVYDERDDPEDGVPSQAGDGECGGEEDEEEDDF
eukprot:12836221-Prorocentrum_lima.AAC.1